MNQNEHAGSATRAAQPKIALGAWNFYFLLKFALFWRGLIGFHALENLAFAAYLLAPLQSPRWRRVRAAAAFPLALMLLYRDSWLPPLARVVSQASLLANFSFVYLVELLGRFVNWQVIALLTVLWAAYRLLARHVRVGLFVVATLLVLLAHSPEESLPAMASAASTGADNPGLPKSDSLDTVLREFYAQESRREIRFRHPAESAVPFDIIFIHICSLSWDDLRAVGLDSHPLWRRFDYLFTRFNSAASYSGPAAIRILRGTCGQTPHSGLYSQVADSCYLMSNLQQAGFEPNLLLNHDGHFYDFIGTVRAQGAAMNSVAPQALAGIPVTMHAFDNSPIYGDAEVLSRWLDGRRQNAEPRVAAYYNTVSLHDGNRLNGQTGPSSDSYKQRLTTLLDDIDGFVRKIETSGRRAVVAVIPEHGAAFRGDNMQIAGLREIPTPAIAGVPVGIRVVGSGVKRNGEAQVIKAPASYMAVSHLIARMLDKSPFDANGFVPEDYLADMPTTEFVAENEGVVMMRRGDTYFLREDKEGWKPYRTDGPVDGAGSEKPEGGKQ